jgi:hypothetical protein
VIETSRGDHVIRSGAFPTELRKIDAAIRKAMPHDRSPDPFAVIPVLERWEAKTAVRVTAMIAGAVLAVAPITIVSLTGQLQLAMPAALALLIGLVMIGLGAFHRGTVTLDRRGLFVARGSTTSFIAWSELDTDKLAVHQEMMASEVAVCPDHEARPRCADPHSPRVLDWLPGGRHRRSDGKGRRPLSLTHHDSIRPRCCKEVRSSKLPSIVI